MYLQRFPIAIQTSRRQTVSSSLKRRRIFSRDSISRARSPSSTNHINTHTHARQDRRRKFSPLTCGKSGRRVYSRLGIRRAIRANPCSVRGEKKKKIGRRAARAVRAASMLNVVTREGGNRATINKSHRYAPETLPGYLKALFHTDIVRSFWGLQHTKT